MPNVWILGGYQSDFARNLSREGRDFGDLTADVVDSTLAAAKCADSRLDGARADSGGRR
jgi:acetyl-CoA C-acetyltransferase